MEHRDGWGERDNATEAAARAERERARAEFYATYDVMTGVRIAATLGGFFALMVFLVVYKSRSKSVKALNDPKLVELAEAVVAEEVAEEEARHLELAIEEALEERARSRPSLGEAIPPRRSSRASHPPHPRDRRLSSATWSSSGSEYLERRGSSAVCSLAERRQSACVMPRLAPLASVGSGGASCCSAGADSVFLPDVDESTDDEVEQFSTDSGGTELPTTPRRLPLPVHRPNTSRETLF